MSVEMAATKRCSTCNKPAPMHCTGCDKYFCSKDFETHREGIFIEMDKIVEERNCLQDAINKTVQNNDQQNPVIAQINQWENNIIEKVKTMATRARQQAIQLLNSKRMKINIEFKDFSRELADLKESKDYVEHDLTRLNQMISQFKKDLEQSTQPTLIKLNTEQTNRINWDTLIYLEEKQTHSNKQQQQAAEEPQVAAPSPQKELRCLSYPIIEKSLFSESIRNVCHGMRQTNGCNFGGRACPQCIGCSFYISSVIITYCCLVHTR